MWRVIGIIIVWVVEYYDGYRVDVDVGVVGVIGLRFRVVDI